MLNEKIKIYLDSWCDEVKPLTSFHEEFKVADEIKNILQSEKQYEASFEDVTERATFSFVEDYANDESGWGTYHGPMFVLPNEQGQMIEYPSIQRVSKATLEYWVQRAKQAKNPVFTYRYANLVIDFHKVITKKGPSLEMFQMTIDSAISICELGLAVPLDCKTKLRRALQVAISISDDLRIGRVKNSIILLEENIEAEDKSPGLWGFAFKWLLLDHSDKVTLDITEERRLLKSLEARLERVKGDPWKAEHAVMLLAEYYAQNRKEEKLLRVLKILEKSLKSNERANSSALLKYNAYDHILQIYRKYSHFGKALTASNRITRELGALDLDWNDSMKTISVETEVPHEKIIEHLASIFGESDEKTLHQVMSALAVAHLPKQDFLEGEFDKSVRDHPLLYHITNQVISDDGVLIAKLHSGLSDRNNHLARHTRQSIEIGSFFLSLSLDELRKKNPKEDVIAYFEKALLFEKENHTYLDRAITAYYESDYLLASHLFCPLIESAIRYFIRKSGGQTLEVNDLGGYRQITLGRLLNNSEIFESVFNEFGGNLRYYLRIVLVDNLGFNLRNDFAHGIGKDKFFHRITSDILFHVMIWLTMVVPSER